VPNPEPQPVALSLLKHIEDDSMNCSRRDFAFLISALAAVQPAAHPAGKAGAQNAVLGSKAFRFEDLSVRESGPVRIFQIFTGTTRSGYRIDMHETELAAGQAPHAPHRHVHEELVLIREGLLEFTIAGQKTQLGAGSGAYVAANEDHGFRNIGTAPAKYFVLALGQDKP
jgi:quercetin dioxygenase-like cupin family protein